MRPLPPVILFDLDDTLVSFSASGDFWPVAFAAQGGERLSVDVERFCAAIDRASSVFWGDAQRAFEGRLDLVWARRQVVRLAFEELRLGAEFHGIGCAIADDLTYRKEEAVAPFPGAIETLERLRELGVRLALLTNGHGDFQRRKLQRYGLQRYFETILIEGELGVGKPDASVFHEALRRMGVRPSAAWMVGDNLHADIHGAQSLGITGVWNDHARKGLPIQPPAVPDHIIHSVQELIL